MSLVEGTRISVVENGWHGFETTDLGVEGIDPELYGPWEFMFTESHGIFHINVNGAPSIYLSYVPCFPYLKELNNQVSVYPLSNDNKPIHSFADFENADQAASFFSEIGLRLQQEQINDRNLILGMNVSSSNQLLGSWDKESVEKFRAVRSRELPQSVPQGHMHLCVGGNGSSPIECVPFLNWEKDFAAIRQKFEEEMNISFDNIHEYRSLIREMLFHDMSWQRWLDHGIMDPEKYMELLNGGISISRKTPDNNTPPYGLSFDTPFDMYGKSFLSNGGVYAKILMQLENILRQSEICPFSVDSAYNLSMPGYNYTVNFVKDENTGKISVVCNPHDNYRIGFMENLNVIVVRPDRYSNGNKT